MTQRTDRVDELLRQEIGVLIAREISDPRIGFVTITKVETQRDLRHAKVWVSVIGTPTVRDEALHALGRAMPFIRHELGKRIRIQRIPELHLRVDDTLERGTRVLQLLSDLEAGTEPVEAAPTEDPLPTPVARLPHEGDAPEPPSTAEGGPGWTGPDVARPGRQLRRRRGAGGSPSLGRRSAPRRRGGQP
ncbi:MAG TPA: 30S ribosome-binding factor RbfA [Candidatus Limnocylindrales bacterium]|nr:30S ribosome-binding factor RbfA [Candidatus Limnocylindrales bacterium]